MKNGEVARSTKTPIAMGECGPGKSASNAKAGTFEGVRFSRAEIEAMLTEIVGGGSCDWVMHPDTWVPQAATVLP